MQVIQYASPLLALAFLLACAPAENGAVGKADSAAGDVPIAEGFADAMEAEALAEPPCLTSPDTVRRNWTRHAVPSLDGEIMLPPRFEVQSARDSREIEWVNPDSARLSLIVSSTAHGEHAVGSAIGGRPERRCSTRVGGRASKLVELVVPRPRGDTAYGAITIAFPSDSVTISATIIAPTRDARAELLNALSTLTFPAKS